MIIRTRRTVAFIAYTVRRQIFQHLLTSVKAMHTWENFITFGLNVMEAKFQLIAYAKSELESVTTKPPNSRIHMCVRHIIDKWNDQILTAGREDWTHGIKITNH